MEVDGELFYSPPHFREHEDGKSGQTETNRQEAPTVGEASLLLCLARERQISANLRKVLEKREDKLAATQREASHAADAQDLAAISAEKTLLERRLQQEKRTSAELRRDLLTRAEECAHYKKAITAGLKRLRETIRRERRELGERDQPNYGAEGSDFAPEEAQGLLEKELERLVTVCHLVQERQLRELRERSQVDRTVLEGSVEALKQVAVGHEVRGREEGSEDRSVLKNDALDFRRKLEDVTKALEEQRETLDSKCQELERTRRDSSDQTLLITQLQQELSTLRKEREDAVQEMRLCAEEYDSHKKDCSMKEAEPPAEALTSSQDAEASPSKSGGGIEDLFLLPHRPRPRPKSDAGATHATSHEEQAEAPKVSSQSESHKPAERPRKKSKVLFQTPMLEVQESTIMSTRTRSQTTVRTESSEIISTENKGSPHIQRRTRKITEVHD